LVERRRCLVQPLAAVGAKALPRLIRGDTAVGHYTGSVVDISRLLRPPAARLACLFLASRLAMLSVGLLSTWLLPSGRAAQPGNLVFHDPEPRALEIWARWDSEWYLLIAAEGYEVGNRLEGLGLPYDRSATAGFLPLYPALIRVLSPILGPVGAGFVISNLCLLLCLMLLERLVRIEVGGAAGEQAGLVSCAALLLFPSSLFLSAVYAESLFLLLSIGVFVSARTGRFALAGILGGLATLTRPFGVLLIIPLLWELWSQRREDDRKDPRPGIRDGLWVGLLPLALGGYMLFCRSVFGDGLALLHRQERWRGGLSGPWRAFVRWWEAGPTAHGAHGSTYELITALICLTMLVFMVRKLRPSYTLYCAACMAVALGSSLWSFSRLALTLFPFFMLIGVSWAEGKRCLPVLYAFLGAMLSGLFVALFANWWWVG